MTEEQRQKRRDLKAETVTALLGTDLGLYEKQLDRTDPRIGKYVRAVLSCPEAHNLYELRSLLQFFHKCDRYKWKGSEVRKRIRLNEMLKFKTDNGRQSFKLSDVECYIFGNIFGFWTDEGRRLTREGCLFVPRKFGKTALVAGIVTGSLYLDGASESYAAANSYQQAKRCFDEIRGAVKTMPGGLNLFKVNREHIECNDPLHASSADCLTANAETKDGLNASLIVMDEYSQAKDAGLFTTLTTSMGMRENPLTLIITTASDKLEGPFYAKLLGYQDLLEGKTEDDRTFAFLFMPDVDDEDGDPATWRKVHPHLGITVKEDFYAGEWAKAQRDANEMLAFRTKLLNRFVSNSTDSWLSPELARDIMQPFDPMRFEGRPPAMLAIDLSESNDLTAVSCTVYDKKAVKFFMHTKYFLPRGSFDEHPDRLLWRTWHEQGHLTLTDGPVINYKQVVAYIMELNKKVRILQIGYDAWKSQELINALAAMGASNVLTPVKQTYVSFTAPCQQFEHHAKTGGIVVAYSPITAYSFGNAVLDEDNIGNFKPIKISDNRKIDGIVTMLMTLRLFMDYRQ